MKTMMNMILLLAWVLCLAPAAASDLAKERRWADQITGSLVVGDAVWLHAGELRFLGLYTPAATPRTRGGVILMHGTGVHPNWHDVIFPLRTELPDHGWATLSIQMPVLANGVKRPAYRPLLAEVAPRVEAAIDFLQGKGVHPVVLAGHSLGATMAASYLASHPHSRVRGLIAIGISASPTLPEMDAIKLLRRIHIPVLDLYGSDDLLSVVHSDARRREAARAAGNTAYEQQRVAGARHTFRGREEALVEAVAGWLNRLGRR